VTIKTPKDYGLDSSSVEMDAASHIEVDSPFDLKAEDFLNCAEEDIKGNKDKDIINALSNAKRAIENRADLLLYAFGYPILEEQWNFPNKVEILNNIGVTAPRILRKINKIRNLLEHKYKLPTREEVEDAIDVAILFLEYTKRFIYDFVNDFLCYDKDNHIDVKFIDHTEMRITVISSWRTSNLKEHNFSITYKDSTFCDWLRFLVEAAY